nr:MAG TPA_asm: hypothetical protein [Caudoviricetes sp.]
MKKITLEDIKAWREAQLAETQDAEEREEIVDKAKLQAFYLGALDRYARWTKEPQDEFWAAVKQGSDYEYKVGHLPEWGNPYTDDFDALEDAYDKGEYEGEAVAERYNEEVLPRELENAKSMLEETKGETRSEFAEAESECDRIWARECLDNYRMLKERMDSDECGWGANWGED